MRLERLGVTWSVRGDSWDEMYAALIEYKRQHGNCNVPIRWPSNPRLGNWVFAQRQYFRNKNLTADRVQRLNDAGIDWEPT